MKYTKAEARVLLDGLSENVFVTDYGVVPIGPLSARVRKDGQPDRRHGDHVLIGAYFDYVRDRAEKDFFAGMSAGQNVRPYKAWRAAWQAGLMPRVQGRQ